MNLLDRLRTFSPRAAAWVEPHYDMLRKAVSFAMIGVVNVIIDAGVFFLAYSYLKAGDAVQRPLDALAASCACVSRETMVLVIANVNSWLVAVSCSYAMNSFVTFAAES